MIRSYYSIIGTPFVAFHDAQVLALLRDVIVNPETGKVEAFWVKPAENVFANLIIQTQDILEWKKKIYIRNEKVMSEPEEVIRITEILKRNLPIIDQKVEGQSGISYGRVADLDFEDKTFFLRQIFTQKRFLGLFSYASYFFTFKRIIQITPQKIIVDDDASNKTVVIAPSLSEG